MSQNHDGTRLAAMVFTVANELANHYGQQLNRQVIDEITRNLVMTMCDGPDAWAFQGKQSADIAEQGEQA